MLVKMGCVPMEYFIFEEMDHEPCEGYFELSWRN